MPKRPTTSGPPVDLGPFRLLDIAGRGAMGRVWRAVHRASETEVAVKEITTTRDAAPEVLRNFDNELGILARLDHDSVIQIYDHGVIPAELDGHRDLVGGAPWFAMEWCGGGTMRMLQSWSGLSPAVEQTLRALAHAHARGVLHLDVKPVNILRSTTQDVRPGWKLADFGIGRIAGQMADDAEVRGTPAYMAPEQIRDKRDHLGPWTDLYALACSVWLQVCREAPYGRGKPKHVILAHLNGIRRPFKPSILVPKDLGAWLRWCLEREPGDRPQVVADALQAFVELGPPVESEVEKGSLTTDDGLNSGGTTFNFSSSGPVPDYEPDREFGVASVPARWDDNDPESSQQLWATGLGMYGLRDIGVVGRRRERTALWNTLKAVSSKGGVRGVLISGAAGTGKSRLGRWFVERVNETGAANGFIAHHSRVGGNTDGVAASVASLMRAPTQSVDRALKVLLKHRWIGDGIEAKVLASWMVPGTTLHSSPEQPLIRVLSRASKERPLVWVIDDSQWGPEAVALATRLSEVEDLNMAVVLVVRDEALAERSDVQELITGLTRTIRPRKLPLARMPVGAHRELVTRLLGLNSGIVDEVVERTRGNPLFANQLVGDWVQRGLLVPSSSGWILQKGARLDLPDDLHEVWTRRMNRLLTQQDDSAIQCLEVAAALGHRVDLGEWRLATEILGVQGVDELVDVLASARLVSHTESRMEFIHGMLRESIERGAREAGRFESVNSACAQMLIERKDPQAMERRARFLEAAQDLRAALEQWVVCCEAYEQHGDLVSADRAVSQWRRVMQQLGLAARDPLWAQGLARTAQLRMVQSRDLETLEAATAALGHPKISRMDQARVHTALGVVRKRQGDLAAAQSHIQQARKIATRMRDHELTAWMDLDLARLAMLQRDRVRAGRLITRVVRRMPKNASPVKLVDMNRMAALHAWWKGELDEALELAQAALVIAEESGIRLGVGFSARELCALHWARGEYERAGRVLEKCGMALIPTGEPRQSMVRVYEAALSVVEGKPDQGIEVAQAATEELEAWGRQDHVLIADAVLLAARMHGGDVSDAQARAVAQALCRGPWAGPESLAMHGWLCNLASRVAPALQPALESATPSPESLL